MTTCSSPKLGSINDHGETSRDYNSNKVGLSLDNLPALNSQSSLVNTGRSRKPLSCSQAEALNNILDDGPYPLQQRSAKQYESGYFSCESKTSLLSEGCLNGDEIESFNHEKLEPLLCEIAEEFGQCWKEVGRHLLKKECSIENINEDYSKVDEKSYQMLLKWKREKGKMASIKDIFKCLIHIGKEEVAEKLLTYLSGNVARECEEVLLSSPKNIRCASMTTPIHNIEEQHKELTVEKQLRLRDEEEIYLCSSNTSKKRYLLKEVEENGNVFRWAARPVISEKQLLSKKKSLRKTGEFLRDLQFKEETVSRLKRITEKLRDKLHINQMTFCEEMMNCSNCEKTALMRELLENNLILLQNELDKMIKKSRRLSISGIPAERIYELANRAYSVCEEHKEFHDKVSKISKLSRRCSMELLESDDDETQTDNNEDPIECTLNILRQFGRSRKVVQSMTGKERKKHTKKVQRHLSDKSKSRFYVPVEVQEREPRPSWPTRIGSKIFPQRKKSSEKQPRDHRRHNSAKQAQVPRESNVGPNEGHFSRCNTFPSTLVSNPDASKPPYSGPNDLDLDDAFIYMKGLNVSNGASGQPDQLRDNQHVRPNNTTSVPNLRENVALRRDCVTQQPLRNGMRDNVAPSVMEILTREKDLVQREKGSGGGNDVNEGRNLDVPDVQSTPSDISTVSDVMWNTEIDNDKVYFV